MLHVKILSRYNILNTFCNTFIEPKDLFEPTYQKETNLMKFTYEPDHKIPIIVTSLSKFLINKTIYLHEHF